MESKTQTELTKDFVGFLKSHKLEFNYVYKEENGDPKKIYAVFSTPQEKIHLWGWVLLTICLEHDEFEKIIINTTRLIKILTPLNEARIKLVTASVTHQQYQQITFEIEQWLMGITIDAGIIALDQSDDLFTELLETFGKYIENLPNEKVLFIIRKNSIKP